MPNQVSAAVEYASIPHSIRVLIWPEATVDDLADLVGVENVTVIPGGAQVRNGDGEWFTLGSGWAVAVHDDGLRNILTPGILNSKYRPA